MIRHSLFLWLTIFFLISFFPNAALSQSINFEDGFEDGNFTNAPSWQGNSSNFIVVNESPNHLLRLDGNPNGDTSYLSTASTDSLGSWELYLKIDFSPSGGNNAHIFLMSDIADLKGAVNGYALRAGESGSDDVFRIVRYDDGLEAETILSGTTDISGGGAYRVKITRQSGGKWSMEVAEGYDGLLKSEGGTKTDAIHSSTNYFGLRAAYTSSRADKFWFDFKIDLPPLSITQTKAGKSTVDLTFNRPYDPSTVERSDFSVNKEVGSPASLSFPDSVTISLNYGNPLPSNHYQLTINNISDRNGKSLPDNTKVEFIIFGSYNSGDVIINEFAYDPPNSFDEYLEIKNRSDKFLNLKDWQIRDATAAATISQNQLVIEPDSFLVVSSDTTALNATFGTAAYHYMSSFPTLNNNGDAIEIITAKGISADSLSYTSGWKGTEYALERRSPQTPAGFKENWGPSPASKGGTPGRTNQVANDEQAPSISQYDLLNKSKIRVIFSERLNQESATDLSNYNFSPNREVQLITSSVDTVTIYLAEPLISEKSYTLSISNVSDIFSNNIANIDRKLEYVAFKSARPGDIVINELMINPDADSPEFIELYNRSNKNIKLSGWTLGDAANKLSINQNIEFRAHQYLVLTGNSSFAQINSQTISLPGFPNLNNAGDAVYLLNASGSRIDSLYYRSNWTHRPEHYSMERQDPYAASNDSSNWQSHISKRKHSAGKQNENYQKDKVAPTILFAHQLPDGQIELLFNEFIQRTDELRFSLNGTTLPVSYFNPENGNEIILQQSTADIHKHPITVQNLEDIRGNKKAQAEASLALPIQQGDLVINEIMYHPMNKNDDNKPDQSEYIELYNTRDYPISLEGLILHDAEDEDGNIRTLRPVSTTAKWVEAQETVLVYADDSQNFHQSKVATYFGLQPGTIKDILRVDRSGLSLASAQDAIFLADSTGTIIDSVLYSEKWHNPNLIDTRGVALERISPSGPSSDQTNWGSSVATKGGTPKGSNSIYQDQTSRPQEVGISFSPNPFSPDDDGYEDNLIISYKLNQPDYLLRVHIFDRYGRQIKKLADGKAAGFEGQLIWDGRRDDGGRNRIGIYIVIFKAIDSASGKDKVFKKTVVIARKLN